MRSRRHDLAIAVVALTAACGSSRPAVEAPDDDAASAFSDSRGYKPTSFGVEVTGEGRPIIFIPGLGCPGEMWNATVAHLGDDYQAHVITLAGFAGRAPIKTPLSATVRKELTRYIRSHRIERPIIVGHSMGGLIAYWLAERHPELVGPVIIVDAGPALSTTDPETGKKLRANWTKVSDEEFQRQARALFASMTSEPKRIAPFLEAIASSDPKSMGNAIYELVTTDLRDRVAAIRAPVLVVLADGIFQQQIRAQVEPIPDKVVKVLKGTRHFVFLDNPELFWKTIDAFLADHPADDDDDDDDDDRDEPKT